MFCDLFLLFVTENKVLNFYSNSCRSNLVYNSTCPLIGILFYTYHNNQVQKDGSPSSNIHRLKNTINQVIYISYFQYWKLYRSLKYSDFTLTASKIIRSIVAVLTSVTFSSALYAAALTVWSTGYKYQTS